MYKQIRKSDYEINEEGAIRNKKTGTIRKYQEHHGYYVVNLDLGGGRKRHFVHRLVAEAFIPKIVGKEYINHKNCNKKDNRVDNLEWCTIQENNTHAYKNANNMAQKVPVFSIDKETHEIKKYNSLYEASKDVLGKGKSSKEIGRNAEKIKQCCKEKAKTRLGKYWRYDIKENYEDLEDFIFKLENKYTKEQQELIKTNKLNSQSIKRRKKLYGLSFDEAIKYKKGHRFAKPNVTNKGVYNPNSKCQQGLGKRFGNLVVKEIIRENGKKPLYKCQCDCGNEIVTQYTNLWVGCTKSCGKHRESN